MSTETFSFIVTITITITHYLFLKFLHDVKSFNYDLNSKEFSINTLPRENTCLLKEIAEPLQFITDHLKKRVKTFTTTALALNLFDNRWEVKT